MAVARPQILTGYCWEISAPCCVHLSTAQNTAAGSAQREQVKREWEKPPNKPQTTKSLIAKMTFHYFCHTLFIKNESVNSAQTQELGITRGHEYQVVRIMGRHLRGCSHQRWFLVLWIFRICWHVAPILCFIYVKSHLQWASGKWCTVLERICSLIPALPFKIIGCASEGL